MCRGLLHMDNIYDQLAKVEDMTRFQSVSPEPFENIRKKARRSWPRDFDHELSSTDRVRTELEQLMTVVRECGQHSRPDFEHWSRDCLEHSTPTFHEDDPALLQAKKQYRLETLGITKVETQTLRNSGHDLWYSSPAAYDRKDLKFELLIRRYELACLMRSLCELREKCDHDDHTRERLRLQRIYEMLCHLYASIQVDRDVKSIFNSATVS